MGEAAGRKYLEDVLAIKLTPEVVSAMLSCSRCSPPWASSSRLQGRAAYTHLAVSVRGRAGLIFFGLSACGWAPNVHLSSLPLSAVQWTSSALEGRSCGFWSPSQTWK